MKTVFSVLFALFASTACSAEVFGLDYLKTIKQIEVLLDDGATGACWTNLKESREYAEEKVRMAGGKLYDVGDKYYGQHYLFRIKVRSQRAADGGCFGFYEIALLTATAVNGEEHNAYHRSLTNAFAYAANANTYVIEAIQMFFSPD